MGVQARLGSSKTSAKDEESLPLTHTTDNDGEDGRSFKDHHPRQRAVARWLGYGLCGTAILYLLASLPSNNGSSLDFPWPRPPVPEPAPEPSFIKEGIRQCEIISRPPPNHKPASEKRRHSDRFVEGTKAVWLKNATIWTGEKGGEEVLYGKDVLLDGGVIRAIGSSDDIQELVKGDKDIEHVQLNGAWLTPGKCIHSFTLLLTHEADDQV